MRVAVRRVGPCPWLVPSAWGVALAAALAGCIEADYPGRWPALAPASGDCPSIAGRYRNEGERGESTGVTWPVHLTGFLMPELPDSEAATIDTVEISEPAGAGGVIEIAAVRGGQVVSSRRLLAGQQEYECVDGCIETSSSRWANEQAVGKQWDTDAYCRGVDGSLIVKSTSSGAGVILLVIPVGGSESNWFRFRPRGYP